MLFRSARPQQHEGPYSCSEPGGHEAADDGAEREAGQIEHRRRGQHLLEAGHHLEESRAVLATADPEIETRVIEPAGHWVNYEEAEPVNALLLDWLARPAR